MPLSGLCLLSSRPSRGPAANDRPPSQEQRTENHVVVIESQNLSEKWWVGRSEVSDFDTKDCGKHPLFFSTAEMCGAKSETHRTG